MECSLSTTHEANAATTYPIGALCFVSQKWNEAIAMPNDSPPFTTRRAACVSCGLRDVDGAPQRRAG
eukprot:4399513-Prymnesium_polylepis.1